MKTINIKGKEYVEVNERIKYFRENHQSGQILTYLVSDVDGKCTFKAEVLIEGECVATGHAYEVEGSTFINKTSYIENCETSAVGRALGNFGIGIDTSVASADEVVNAINNQNSTSQPKKKDTPSDTPFEGKELEWKEQRKFKLGGSGKYKDETWESLEANYVLWLIHKFPDTEWGDTEQGKRRTACAVNERDHRKEMGRWSNAEEQEFVEK
ncbi:hypothetical protein CMI37_14215 [Candidatus Pacearchaeota archaeon]|nr:hypothetical protein [Candidatus Pacearchaeota archaeon]|tara:strand:+ start:5971 stop:6606 length:636 start_codon:yes stop_codon:yes gene_type:complete